MCYVGEAGQGGGGGIVEGERGGEREREGGRLCWLSVNSSPLCSAYAHLNKYSVIFFNYLLASQHFALYFLASLDGNISSILKAVFFSNIQILSHAFLLLSSIPQMSCF